MGAVRHRLEQRVSAAELPAWSQVNGEGSLTGALLALLLILLYVVMAALLLIQMLVRLATVDALLIVAPAALVCWILPQTNSWARLWVNTFFGTVLPSFWSLVVLRLGAELTAGMAAQIPAPLLQLAEGMSWASCSESPRCTWLEEFPLSCLAAWARATASVSSDLSFTAV